MSENSTLLTVEQTCERLLLSEPTLRRYAKTRPDFPRKVKIGIRRVAYLKADIDAYLDRQREAARAAA